MPDDLTCLRGSRSRGFRRQDVHPDGRRRFPAGCRSSMSVSMSAFLSRYVADPIPEVQFVDGRPRLSVNPQNPRLPVVSLLKYYVSLNPKNYSQLRLSSKPPGTDDKWEIVEPELRPYLRRQGSAEGNLPEGDPLDHSRAGGRAALDLSDEPALFPTVRSALLSRLQLAEPEGRKDPVRAGSGPHAVSSK